MDSPRVNAAPGCAEGAQGLARLRRVAGTTILGAMGLAVRLALAVVPSDAVAAQTVAAPPKGVVSSEDGMVDLSNFIDQAYGFLPILVPITEPAVGYGAAGGLAFIDKPLDETGKVRAGFDRPNITFVGGMATENGTWGTAVGDIRHWKKDQVKTIVGAIYASVNLDFYGIGENSLLKNNPLTYNLEPLGGLAQVQYRLGPQSRTWVGISYALFSTQVSFDAPATTPGLPSFDQQSRIGGLTPSLTFDSRDTIFTPTRGTSGPDGFRLPLALGRARRSRPYLDPALVQNSSAVGIIPRSSH